MKKLLIGFIAGCILMFTGTVLAENVKQFILVEAPYPVYVDGEHYESETLPVLNYEGSTYVPLRAIGDLLGAPIKWNAAEFRVEIGQAPKSNDGDDLPGGEEDPVFIDEENEAFRHLSVVGSDGVYIVRGEANVSDQIFYFSVSDGHNYILDDKIELPDDGDAWVDFELQLKLASEDLPWNGTLMLELYDGLDADGFRTKTLFIPLQQFVP